MFRPCGRSVLLNGLLLNVIVFTGFLMVVLRVQNVSQVSSPMAQQSRAPIRPMFASWPGILSWTGQSSAFHVLYNYIPAEVTVGQEDSVTYTTHGTSEFLRHLEPLSHRWGGPVSVAMYAPGEDFFTTVRQILLFRKCSRPSVRKYVTFHLFFEKKHAPRSDNTSYSVPWHSFAFLPQVNIPDCNSKEANLLLTFNNLTKASYRKSHNLTYPVNTARNIARISARTTYVLASDIELYPSVNIIPPFLKLLNTLSKGNNTRKIFVLPVFEVSKTVSSPLTKSELVKLYQKKQAVTFHKFFCLECHRIPKEKEWLKQKVSNDSLGVFQITRRKKNTAIWEPIYIGTNQEPLYDERFNWEGMGDKMTQMYEMCLMGYDLYILDNAFLVHAPGIKIYDSKERKGRQEQINRQNKLKSELHQQLGHKYPKVKDC